MQGTKSYNSYVKKKCDLYIQIPQFESQLCQFPALQLWVSHLTFLNFSSLICKVEMIITLSVMGCCEDEVSCFVQSA